MQELNPEQVAEAVLRLIDHNREEFSGYLEEAIAEAGGAEWFASQIAVSDVRYTPNEPAGTDVLISYAGGAESVLRTR